MKWNVGRAREIERGTSAGRKHGTRHENWNVGRTRDGTVDHGTNAGQKREMRDERGAKTWSAGRTGGGTMDRLRGGEAQTTSTPYSCVMLGLGSISQAHADFGIEIPDPR